MLFERRLQFLAKHNGGNHLHLRDASQPVQVAIHNALVIIQDCHTNCFSHYDILPLVTSRVAKITR